MLITRWYYNTPSVKERYAKRGIYNPYSWYIKFMIRRRLIAGMGVASWMGGGLAAGVLLFFLMGMYYFIEYLFFFGFKANFIYLIIILAVLAYALEFYFSDEDDKAQQYIQLFNKKKGWWRVKWGIITALSPFASIAFAMMMAALDW